MPRKPKPKNTLSAGERAKLYEAALVEKQRRLSDLSASMPADTEESEAEYKHSENGTDVEAMPRKTGKKQLPKPESATVRVNFALPTGEIRPVHGVCNGPLSYGADLSALFSAVGVPYVRLDSYALEITRIFRDLDADPLDEDSYDFSVTDRYVEAALKCGAKLIFRLGEQLDLLQPSKKRYSPAEIDRLTQAALKIIDHYNEYFATGYSLEILYFELWGFGLCEDVDADFEAYRKMATAVKLHDSRLQVGGICFEELCKEAREFLRFCKKHELPLDFLSLSYFGDDPLELDALCERTIGYLANMGFTDCELLIGKWCFIDKDALGNLSLQQALQGELDSCKAARKAIFKSQGSVKSAAFSAASLLQICRREKLLTACYYNAEPMISPFGGLCDRFGDPQKPYYAFSSFSTLCCAGQAVYCESMQKEGFAHSGIYAAAALPKMGDGYIMLASFGGCGTVDLRLEEIPERFLSAEVMLLDGVKNLESGLPGAIVPLSGMKKRLVLNLSEYAVALIKLY